MKRFEVGYASAAEDDLRAIADWVTDADGPTVALGYVARIRAFCARLETFPDRGTLLGPGVRRIGFERRCTVLFAVAPPHVIIARVLYGGRRAVELKESSA